VRALGGYSQNAGSFELDTETKLQHGQRATGQAALMRAWISLFDGPIQAWEASFFWRM
jgi:hypothetical protein